jgi:sulfide:quinone oxidoreductase
MLMPNAGPKGSAWMGDRLAERQIEHRAGVAIENVEPARIALADGALAFDLLVCVPPHRAPEVVEASGLAGGGNWISVDPGTLETSHPRVYAVGDVNQIPLANKLPLPKAGVIAELEGERIAAAIASDIRGEAAPPPFDGHGFCFIELGTDSAALVDGDFYATPEPRASIVGPAPEHAAEKRRFESERLERWFGG